MNRYFPIYLFFYAIGLAGISCSATAGEFARNSLMKTLPVSVDKALKRHKISDKGLSIYVKDVGAKNPLLAMNIDKPTNPASVMKMLTALSSISELGPAYKFTTEFYTDRKIEHGILNGNLYIKGYGDPFITIDSFRQMLSDLRNQGLKVINGNVIIDENYIYVRKIDPGAFDGRPYHTYNAQPNALLINFSATKFRLFPNYSTRISRIVAEPDLSTLLINNAVRTVSGRCDRRARNIQISVEQNTNKSMVTLTGSIPQKCPAVEFSRTILSPHSYLYGLFRRQWKELGGEIEGHYYVNSVPDDGQLILKSFSKPLGEILILMNKYSNNIMAKTMLLNLGAEKYGAPGTYQKGRDAVSSWFAKNGINDTGFYMENGSGLSRKGKITARTMAESLEWAFNAHIMPEFISSLPIASLDGTLRRRYTTYPFASRLHAKTGFLKDVRSIAGYLHKENGRRRIVIMLHEDRTLAARSLSILDKALLSWAYQMP